jgi:hypothetical protein
MAQNFLSFDRDQPMLLPPDLRDWLSDDHVAWFVIDAVRELDLEPFYVSYRSDGHGRAAHDPQMPETERSTGADLVQDFAERPLARNLGVFGSIGTLGVIVAVTAAGIALRRNPGAPVSVLVLLVLSGFLITAHPPPFGPTGLVLFVVAVLLFWRSQSAAVREPANA